MSPAALPEKVLFTTVAAVAPSTEIAPPEPPLPGLVAPPLAAFGPPAPARLPAKVDPEISAVPEARARAPPDAPLPPLKIFAPPPGRSNLIPAPPVPAALLWKRESLTRTDGEAGPPLQIAPPLPASTRWSFVV